MGTTINSMENAEQLARHTNIRYFSSLSQRLLDWNTLGQGQDDNEDSNQDSDSEGNSSNSDIGSISEPASEVSNSAITDDDDTITEFTRSRVSMYGQAIRTNTEILDDLTAIIRILRQINSLYRVINTNVSRTNGFRVRRRNYHSYNDHNSHGSSTHPEENEDNSDSDEEEANKLLEAGLADLQTVLSMEHRQNRKQSTLALLSLLTYQHRNHCSDQYLRHYLDPNGEFNPELAVFAAATYDEDDIEDRDPKSCQDIIEAAEDLCGADWLDEFQKGKESVLRNILEKLTFIAKIRLKVRDVSNDKAIR
ncbi:hypothetical protein BDB01DRAFT_800458 [Pilobolus umbonatus]|nr:hypothetical protein BDB01DRAFT_800458 [Pilobolus umbonatus]